MCLVPGGYSIFLGGLCCPVLKTHTLFQTLMRGKFANSIDLRHTGLCDSPNDVRVLFSLRSMSTATHVNYSKNGIPDQTDGIYTLFQTKMAKSIPYFTLEMLENDTLWGGTYPYGLYMGVPPPSPRGLVPVTPMLLSLQQAQYLLSAWLKMKHSCLFLFLTWPSSFCE